MIGIHREDNSVVRLFPRGGARRVEYHRRFGFVSQESLGSRQRLRRNAGAIPGPTELEFSFLLSGDQKDLVVTDAMNCVVNRAAQGWRLETPRGAFLVKSAESAWPTDSFNERASSSHYKSQVFVASLFGALLLLMALWPGTKTEVRQTKSEDTQPVIIRTVVQAPKAEAPAPDPSQKAKQTVRQQLGFLNLVGRKDFERKVKGGLPTPTEQATAGAGAGGNAGSGGELLAGMGKGLRQATVGNSGVAGLGGVGTKGAGGGLGGYGDTAYAAAGGEALSAIPLARDAKIDEGLDRAQIQNTILRYLSQVRACYEEGLKRNQALIGQVTMGFEVNGTGALNYAQVQRTSLGDRPVEECIRTKMMNWKFPQPRGGVNVKVSYPFMLRPLSN